jgi:hypothetical protein
MKIQMWKWNSAGWIENQANPGIRESHFHPWDFPSFLSPQPPQVNEQRQVARAARARPESASRRKPTANDQRRVGMRAWRTACCVASDTEKGRTEVVWHILWLVVLMIPSGTSMFFQVQTTNQWWLLEIGYDFLLLSLWACSCCTPLWVTHANHMLTMCFALSAFFREQLSASIAVANVVSPRNLVHVSIGRVGTKEP